MRSLFWSIYMLFFAIPFPMILYYPITGSEGPAHTPPQLVVVWLALSALLWIMYLYRLLKGWVLGVFQLRAHITRLLAQGTRVPATVTDCVVAGPARKTGEERLQVTLSFANFAGEQVTETMEINDSKPYERRYETGKTVYLRIDPDVKPPCILPDSTVIGFRKGVLVARVIGWGLIVAAIAGYYFFSYQYEGRGVSWAFMVFLHPLILCPLILLFNDLVIGGLLRKHLGPGKHDLRLKLYGRKTMATLKSASQTGLSVNDQPQLLFVLEYTDNLGKRYQVSFKKVVSLLELDIALKEELAIFYLPEAPLIVALASDLE